MKTYKIVGGLVELIGQFFFININRGNVSIMLKRCLYLYLTSVNHHWIGKINLTFIKRVDMYKMIIFFNKIHYASISNVRLIFSISI